MKRTVLLLITLVAPLLFVGVGGDFPSPLGGAGGGFLYAAAPSNVDDMLEKYEQARGREKRALAQQLMDRFLAEEVFFTPPPPLRDRLPADSLNALVYYGAECYYFCANDASLCIQYAQRALPLLKHSYPVLHAHVQSDIARCYYRQGNIQRTIEQGNEAAATCKRIGDNRELARVYSTLAFVYTSQHQGPEAVDYALKAYDTYRQTGDTLITHTFINSIAEAYSVKGDHQNSIKYGKLAVQSARQRGSSPAIIVSNLATLGYAYYVADSLAAAKRVLNESLQLLNQKKPPRTSTVVHQYLGLVYMKEHNNVLAAKHFRQGLHHAKQNGDLRDMCNLQRDLYKALRSTSPVEALHALEQYTTLRDSVYNDEMQEKLSQATATFHNEQLRAENEAARRANRNIMISTTIVVLFFLLAIAALLYAVRTRSRSIKAMRELQQSRETFFTNVTHEFRTPLTVILGMADKLKAAFAASTTAADAEGDVAATDLILIEHNANRLLTLVNQLLDIAKISTSTGNPEWQQGNVVAFVSMIVESFRQPAEQQGVDLTFTATPQAVDTTFASEHLQKILSNLLSNALKFTPAGGSISVGFQQKDKQLMLTVSDTGRGILPADLPHVFDPFFQGTNNTFTGTGVGLALVKQLVESLHGTISVESTPDVGTTFRVEIKEPTTLKPNLKPTPYPSPREGSPITLANDDAASTNTNAEANQSPLPWEGEGGGCSILVVEDNRDVAYYIGSVLGNDYEVAYAYDGAEGIAKAEELMPDLIITDVMMPDVDGLEMCHHIRSSQLTNHIPIIIITARATDDDRLTGIEAGADVYLYKPFRADELQLRVSKLLEQRRMLQEKYSSLTPASPPNPLSEGRGGTQAREESAAAEATALPAIDQASREFIERLRTVVFELMPRGEVDTGEVASRLFMSRSQLGRKTKAIVNKSPATYILEIRLQEAKRLIISQPQLTLLDVALRCGFADNSHLTHAFRRVYKITPTQLRTESS
ncbi:MAG: response regulator [Prevotella sp.]|nr:response regulator [Prevotella sp.]MBQ6194136.1 response regulator [Prevotella sp.]